jgi:hypothetical protein
MAPLLLCQDNLQTPTFNMEVLSFLNFLDAYWRGTDEVNVGEN